MKYFFILFFVLTLVASSNLFAQEQRAKSDKKEDAADDEVLKVDTTVVTVPVSVKNRNGGFITNLRQEDFRIYEDGVEQEIIHFETPDKPFTVALLLDISDSTEIRLKDIQNAAIAFVEQLRPDERVMVVSFDKQITMLAEPTRDRKILFEAIRSTQTGGGTSVYDTIHTVIKRLNRVAGRKAIVIFSDGMDTTSVRATFESTLQAADELSGLIYPIQYNTYKDIMAKQFGVNTSSNAVGYTIYETSKGEPINKAFERGTRYLRMLSHNSGGRFYYADSLNNLRQAFAQIAEELRRQYSIGYYPKNEMSEKRKRKIKVLVSVSEGIVRARNNYIYGSDNR